MANGKRAGRVVIIEAPESPRRVPIAGSHAPDLTRRIVQRNRPEGQPVLSQTWEDALFLHWQVPVEILRPRVPKPLWIDTYKGSAWVTITAIDVRDSQPRFSPPLPWIRDFHEVNVRTYVHYDGIPGVWFFSLDADSRLTVSGARTFFHLPYFPSQVVHEVEGRRVHFRSLRRTNEESASFTATWTARPEVQEASPGSLEFFWVERYSLYVADESELYRARIFHEPWPIREVQQANHDTTLLDVNGIPPHIGEREHVRAMVGGPVHAEIWPLEPLGDL
ncbi:MAG TPA: DUF2071 domain-containing protein [Candidatus Eisenbacteria bacterium]|nr:DUF2071 domain-containing protein [Candidatus Eisenbacteria bacterium]